MRLINADALVFTDGREYVPTGKYITEEEIKNAPTIDINKRGAFGRGFDIGFKEGWNSALEVIVPRYPKHGKWTKHILKNANVPWGYDCSACDGWFVVGEDVIKKYRFCPNCGAQMERSEE